MQKIIWIITGLIAFLNANARFGQGRDTARVEATIKEATVYFGYGAELSHQSRVSVNPLTKIIIIDKISTTVDINSLQISCPENVTLLSRRYSIFYPDKNVMLTSGEIKRLEDSVGLLKKEITRIDNLITTEKEVLAKTGVLIESTLKNNGTRIVSSAEVLKLVEYYNAKIEKSNTAIFNYQQSNNKFLERIVELEERIETVNNNMQEKLTPYGQLILQVICKKAEEIPLSVSYYTNNAGWTPVYDIRVNSTTNKLKLIYKASLTQTTGINWTKTRLTLSTGTPNFGIAAPLLSPWYLQLYVPELYKVLAGRVPGVSIQQNTIQSLRDDKALAEVVVTGLNGYAQIKAEKDTIEPATLQQYTTLHEGQLSTNFDIDLPYDIESDGQLHSVVIKDEEISCSFKNYGVPRHDKDVYLLAEIAEWQNLDLLPGDANIIMDDTYIGKSLLDPNTTMDTLNLSLGRDRRVAVKRSLIKELSTLKTSGGNSRQDFTYEITVKNNKLAEVSLLLKDQFPLSTIKDVEVKLEDNGQALVNEETGVLTWKVNLKPGESKKFRFSYSVKYPRDKKIINLK